MRLVIALLIAIGAVSVSEARIERPLGYDAAEARFLSLPPPQRTLLQVLLTAAGTWNGVPNQSFGNRLFNAFSALQTSIGDAPSGMVSNSEIERMVEIVDPIFSLWGLQNVRHPMRGRPIWVPLGLGLNRLVTPTGLSFIDPLQRIKLTYDYFPMTVDTGFALYLANAAAQGADVTYKILVRDFFVVTSVKDGVTTYSRFHTDGTGILGFDFWWRDDPYVHGDRLVTLISASLWTEMTGAPPMSIPDFSARHAARATAPVAQLPPAQASAPQMPVSAAKEAATAPVDKERPEPSAGTGIFVSADGMVLTNAHVVKGCQSVDVAADLAAPLKSRVVATDATNDLAIVKMDFTPKAVAALRTSVRLGEGVEAFGYPLTPVLSRNGNFTLGNITALAGLGDDSRYFQVSAPLQPGNSGGPLLDQSGNLIGVVTGKLDAIKMVMATGDLPQNVNFAIKASVAQSFLESNQIKFDAGVATAAMAPVDLADRAKAMSVSINCMPQ